MAYIAETGLQQLESHIIVSWCCISCAIAVFMALAFKLWWCPWSIRLGQRLPFGTSYALMVVLLINFIQSWRLFSDHRSTVSVVLSGTIATNVTRLTEAAAGWKIACAGCPSGQSGLDDLVETPPCKVTTLVLYFWITLICWLAWLSLSFVSLFTMRDFVGYRRLLACWPGFIIFWFAEPGQIKFLCCFSSLAVWLELLLFLHDCHILWRRLCFLAAGGGEELLFRVVVKRVLMMLWLYVVVVFAASSSLASTHHSHLFLDTSCTDDGFYSRNRSATVLLKYWNHTL